MKPNTKKTYPRFCKKCGKYFQPLTKYSHYCHKCKTEIRKEAHIKATQAQGRNRMNETIRFNYLLYKEQNEKYKKIIKNTFIKLLNEMSREEIIDILKQKKIIKRDWTKKGEEYHEI